MLVQKVSPNTYRLYNFMIPINITDRDGESSDECPVYKGAEDVEIRDGFLLTNFKSGKIYINYHLSLIHHLQNYHNLYVHIQYLY